MLHLARFRSSPPLSITVPITACALARLPSETLHTLADTKLAAAVTAARALHRRVSCVISCCKIAKGGAKGAGALFATRSPKPILAITLRKNVARAVAVTILEAGRGNVRGKQGQDKQNSLHEARKVGRSRANSPSLTSEVRRAGRAKGMLGVVRRQCTGCGSVRLYPKEATSLQPLKT